MGDNSFVYKKSEFKKNVFEEVDIENTLEEQDIIHEKMTDARVMGQLSQSLDRMAERFSEQFGEEVIPQQMLEEKLDTAHQEVLGAKKLSQGQKTKRAQSAAKKLEEQRNLMQEKHLLVDKLKADNDDVARALFWDKNKEDKKKNLKIFESEYRSEEEKEAVQRWMIKGADEFGSEEMREGLISASHRDLNIEWMNILDEVNQADLSEFEYKSDREFISEYAIKYEKISKYALADAFFLKAVDAEKKGELSDHAGAKDILREARARIEVFKKLRQEYDDRMELISSPFYVLLSEKDISGYKSDKDIKKLEDKEADPEFIEYVKRYQRLVKSDVGKGKSPEAAYKKAIKADYEKEVCIAKRAQAAKSGFANLKKAIDPAQAGKVNLDKKIGTYYMTEINTSTYVRSGMEGVTDDIKQELLNNGYDKESMDDDVSHIGDSFSIRGLKKMRVLSSLEGSNGDGMQREEIKDFIEKLCAVDRKDLDKNEFLVVQGANARVDEGILEYKGIVYNFLKRLESTYGILPTQMHPEDFLRLVGLEFKDHLASLQDAAQLLTAQGLFDFEANEEDKDFKRLTNYYNSVVNGITAYTIAMYNHEIGQERSGDLEFGIRNSFARFSEGDTTGIGGPSMSSEELKEYNKDLKKRAKEGGWSNRLNTQG